MRTPEHKHQYKSFEGFFLKRKGGAYLVAICNFIMDDEMWCGNKVVVESSNNIQTINCEKDFYNFYTGGEDIFLVEVFGKGCQEGDTSFIVIEAMSGIALAHG